MVDSIKSDRVSEGADSMIEGGNLVDLEQQVKTSKIFDNYVTRLFIDKEDIFSNKFKAGSITVLTGLVVLGVLAYLGIYLVPILGVGTLIGIPIIPTWAAAVGGIVTGVALLAILTVLFKFITKATAAVLSRIYFETPEAVTNCAGGKRKPTWVLRESREIISEKTYNFSFLKD